MVKLSTFLEIWGSQQSGKLCTAATTASGSGAGVCARLQVDLQRQL